MDAQGEKKDTLAFFFAIFPCRPELEEQRDGLIKEISAGQDTLKELENKTLQLLAESGDDILDHDDLINTLAASKQTSGEVKVSVERASKTAEEINKTRNSYRPVALRGSVLYFVVVDLASLDPMYQTSLQFFKVCSAPPPFVGSWFFRSVCPHPLLTFFPVVCVYPRVCLFALSPTLPIQCRCSLGKFCTKQRLQKMSRSELMLWLAT